MAKYGKKASDKVERAMHERKRGTLKSGGSGRKVTSRKQAIAIGLSEARREGGKVPSPTGGAKKKSASKRSGGSKKSGGSRKGATKKTARKSTARKSSSRSGTTRKAAAKKR
jgi:hypothetical protein